MDMERKESWQSSLVHLLQEGSIALPIMLFTEYKHIGLSEKEAMLLIQLILFKEKEHNCFPTVDELKDRMSLTADEIICTIQRLVQGGFLAIEEEVNEQGIHSERYSVTPLLEKCITSYVERNSQTQTDSENAYQNIFQLFEKEFGRALSPWECEMLAQWIDVDKHKEELIEAALREAVFVGKLSIRYIDRILLEWQRNQIETIDQAIEYSRKFRQKGILYQSSEQTGRTKTSFSFYNWVNQE
jgi:DNA replication protein